MNRDRIVTFNDNIQTTILQQYSEMVQPEEVVLNYPSFPNNAESNPNHVQPNPISTGAIQQEHGQGDFAQQLALSQNRQGQPAIRQLLSHKRTAVELTRRQQCVEFNGNIMSR